MSLRYIGIIIAFFLLMTSVLKAEPSDGIPGDIRLPLSEDLYADGQLARERNLPILIMFAQDGCHYCDLVREDFLEPMLKSGDYANKVIIRIVKIDHGGSLRDFKGNYSEASEIALSYRAYVTPTVVFLDHRGHELAERLLGISTPDFYGGELDDAIEQSLARVRAIALNRLKPGIQDNL